MNADLEPTKTGKLIHNSLTHTHTYARTQILNFKMLKQYSLQLKTQKQNTDYKKIKAFNSPILKETESIKIAQMAQDIPIQCSREDIPIQCSRELQVTKSDRWKTVIPRGLVFYMYT